MTTTIRHQDSIIYPYRAGQFDHVITDTPYSPHVHKKASTMRGGKAGANDLGFDHLMPLLRASVARRIALANSWSIVFSDWEGVDAWRRDITESGGEYVRVLPWVRWSMPQLSGDRPPQGSEAVILAHPGGKKIGWSGPGNLVCLDHKAMRGKGKHKTQKPLDLMLSLVSYFTLPGATVLDPCAGRGTTLQACRLLGRHALGFEMQTNEVRLAKDRLTFQPDKRDLDHMSEFTKRSLSESADKERMKVHTAKVRKKNAS